MMLYVIKPQWGIAAGSVERFRDDKGYALIAAGEAEPYDPKKHSVPGSQSPSAPAGRRIAPIRK